MAITERWMGLKHNEGTKIERREGEGEGEAGGERERGRRGKERKSGEDGVSKYKKKTVGDQPP